MGPAMRAFLTAVQTGQFLCVLKLFLSGQGVSDGA